jgi:hypothetical protein
MSILSALGLYILVSVFSSGTESDARWKILFIAIGSAIVQAVISHALPTLAGVALAIVASLGFIAVGLIFWCGVERKAAVKIAGSYFALCVGLVILSVLISVFLHRA